ncbi:ABC transporter ATP-binding protein [Anthocerotibacter panamensis]|uniref:ABC transporter ATP-binding protein n=1 Tax=Anthocerotibacter panamensis TaxID=2857077 RepID=UPI001C4014AD|nr:ABC transporter ATP-binding protein [Anthocerotibacter panamensis]
MNPELELNQVYKSFPVKRGVLTVLEDINLTVQSQEFICLVGASGCGKSTLLNLMAGLDRPTQGEVRQRDQIVTGPGRERGLVFQSYTLFPWLTVRENVGFALGLRGISRRDLKERVDAYLEVVQLRAFQDSYPKQLSGGMQQRVAIARALINEPSVLLMDEPFAALDAQTRGLMQDFLLQLWQEKPLTVVLVTHDVGEAVYLCERLYILSSRPGRIVRQVQPGLPRERTYQVRQSGRFQEVQGQVLEWLRVEALKVFTG